ncbi:hypothetical protein DAMNIGENAA_12330 [Desulforhabdus amnigena]|jgi:hypothetical protein|uniref:Uncharacterized protein n=1 Tax=Desulforhabdus amnigena TaxID=40218 RepID=A0A9W6FTF9_9BACT|nr:hypothetical protein DAMNIGENAA_12330 [Desulforhabdus amnigena]
MLVIEDANANIVGIKVQISAYMNSEVTCTGVCKFFNSLLIHVCVAGGSGEEE